MEDLVVKFLTANISDEELEVLKKWLRKPKNQRYFKEVMEADQRLDLAYRPIDAEKAYRRIMEATTENKVARYKQYRSIFKYAAVVMVLIATSFAVYSYFNAQKHVDTVPLPKTSSESQVTLEFDDGSQKILDERKSATITKGNAVVKQEYSRLTYETSGDSEIEPVYNRLIVPYGKRFSVELSDGTIVHLNAGTKLRYPEVFTGSNSRDVYLEGEAFFSVTENASLPFIVHTDKMNVRVFGTKFNVSSYDNENSTSAVLVEGSVGVYGATENYSETDGVVISPNQQAKMQNGEFTIAEVDVQRFIAWMEGKLFFVNDRFEDIIKVLERNYNIKIINKHQTLNDIRYTGTFQEKTLPEILNVFKRNTKFDFEIDNDVVVIIPSPL